MTARKPEPEKRVRTVRDPRNETLNRIVVRVPAGGGYRVIRKPLGSH